MGVQSAIAALSTQPVFYLKLDGSLSNSGTANVGVVTTSGTWTQGITTSPIVDGSYIGCSSTTGYLNAGSPSTMNYTANHTIGFFFKAATPPTTQNIFISINAGTNNRSNSTVYNVIATDGTMAYAGRSGGIVPTSLAKTNASVCDDNWHFIVFVRSGFTYYCYVDGVLQTQTGSVGDSGSSAPAITTFQVGVPTNKSSQTTYYDEYFYAQYALTSTEIASIWNASPFAVSSVDDGYTAEVSTASSLAVDPVITTFRNAEYAGQAMEATNGHFPEPTIQASSDTSIGVEPGTADALIVDSGLSFTQDVEPFIQEMEAIGAEFKDPIISAIQNVDFTSGTLTASADFSATTGISIDDEYTAATSYADGSFSLVDPVVTTEKGVIYTATAATASALSGIHERAITTATGPIQYIAAVDSSLPDSAYGSEQDAGLFRSGTTFVNMAVKFNLPSNLTKNNLLSGYMTFTKQQGTPSGEVTVNVYGYTADWNEATITWNNRPSRTLIGTLPANIPSTNGSSFDFNITSLLPSFKSNGYYGFEIEWSTNTAYYGVYSDDAPTTAYRPTVTLLADMGPADANYVAQVAEASALMADSNLILGIGKTINETPATASALAVDPTPSAGTQGGYTAEHLEAFGILVDPAVSIQRSYNFTQSDGLTAEGVFAHPLTAAEGGTTSIDVAPFYATALMANAVASIPKTVAAETLIASVDIVDPSIESDFNRIVYVGAFSVSAVLLDPTEAVLETDDPYYQEILNTSNLYDTEWFRLDEVTGSIAYSKTKALDSANLQANGTYTGSPLFGNVGPRNRKVIGFTGSQYITVPHTYGPSTTGDYLGAASSQIAEMTIKTVSPVGTLLDGEDANTLAGAGNPIGWTLDLVDGKLRYRKWVVATNVPGTNRLVEYVISGNKRIDDNQWHHIVIQIGNLYNGKDLEIFIDGELDIARFAANDTPIMAHPDRLFGNSVTSMNYAYTGPNPTNQVGSPEPMPNFTGEVMEYVFRPNISLTEYQIEQLYYAALDIATEPAQAFIASATFPEPYVTGNKPKALLLTFWPNSDYKDTPAFNPTFDETPAYTRLIKGGFDPAVYDVWEYYVNRVSARPQITATNNTPGIAGVYRDVVTDEVVLLDPRNINNIDKFDVIQINGYPIDSNDVTNLFQGYNEDKGYQFALKSLETFVSQVRSIVDNYGVSLLVTNPRLATDLGIVSDVEETSSFFERRYSGTQSSQNAGFYDYRAAQLETSEFGVTPTDPYTYFDNHRNNKLRIVSTETGLTDLQDGWMLQDVINHRPRDPLSIERYHYKYKDTRNGLTIGDEMIIPNAQTSGYQIGGGSGDAYNVIRAEDKILAFPAEAVKAGTVLATLGSTYWNGTQEVANPYANYAAVIICKPGDNVNGTTLGGKIFVDCAEVIDTRYANAATFQTTNGDVENPVIPDDSEWQYSTTRLSLTGAQVGTGVDQVITSPEGFQNQTGTSRIQVVNSNGQTYFVSSNSSQLFSIVVEETYPTVQVWAPSLLERGILWLTVKTQVNANDAIIRPQAFTAVDEFPTPTTYINKDIVTNAASMVSNAYLVEPDNVTSVDARIVTLPLTATARITGSGRIFQATPMTASAILNTDSVTFAGGEQVVVTLHEVQSIDLYIKEEAY